ncbi:hypothetical protein IMCC1989_1720 [gamma proteobacterium IMCC1989]|nr:hypothetical protein IMCC1989_1720 [gamma proteobacterium IMCC1989]
MPNSMTGFARQEQQADWGSLSCEIRSVNQRYLEPFIRLPESLRLLEPAIREKCRRTLQRGKVEITLQLTLNMAQASSLTVNKTLVSQLATAAADVVDGMGSVHPIAALSPLDVLQWPGVLEQAHVDMNEIATAAKTLFSHTLDSLLEHRQREGVELQSQIEQRLVAIDGYVDDVRQQMPAIIQAQKEKLQQRLLDLAATIDEDRLAQEVAILVNKSDVDEELDRLSIHLTEVKHILSQQGAIGRRLDFMMQELNREANTLSSKAIHTDTTQTAVSLKVLIEQMREQIQNIE